MQHKHFNELLNGLKVSPPPSATSSISYTHLRLIDSFYQSPDSRDKIRVTRDEKTGKVEQCVRKVRLGDLDIYSPKRAADWRISVNVEVPGASRRVLVFLPIRSFITASQFLRQLGRRATQDGKIG